MSYDNAEPKVLKTLNSSGQVLNDVGDVISDATSYWEKKYVEAEPKPDKILKSDGSVVDSNGNQIQAANEYNVKKYNQAEPIPAKYLHSDGTVDENPGGGSADSTILYAWVEKTSHEVIFTNFKSAPQSIPLDDTEYKCIVSIQNEISELTMSQYIGNGYAYGKTNDDEFYIEDIDTLETEQEFVRDATKDIELWNTLS